MAFGVVVAASQLVVVKLKFAISPLLSKVPGSANGLPAEAQLERRGVKPPESSLPLHPILNSVFIDSRTRQVNLGMTSLEA